MSWPKLVGPELEPPCNLRTAWQLEGKDVGSPRRPAETASDSTRGDEPRIALTLHAVGMSLRALHLEVCQFVQLHGSARTPRSFAPLCGCFGRNGSCVCSDTGAIVTAATSPRHPSQTTWYSWRHARTVGNPKAQTVTQPSSQPAGAQSAAIISSCVRPWTLANQNTMHPITNKRAPLRTPYVP